MEPLRVLRILPDDAKDLLSPRLERQMSTSLTHDTLPQQDVSALSITPAFYSFSYSWSNAVCLGYMGKFQEQLIYFK